jgi:hypothetical protein
MNSHTLCEELYQTIDDVDSGVIRKPAIIPIIEELCNRLKKDSVATSLLGGIRDELVSHLTNKKDHVAEIKVSTELLRTKLDNKYLDETKRLLKETLKDIKQKENISSLTRVFITELISLGYSQEYIYFTTINFFFDGRYPAVIDSISLIDNYLRKFSAKEHNLIAIYRISENFQELSKFAAENNMLIDVNVPPININGASLRIKNFLSSNNELPLYITMKNIKAYDVFAAREDSDDNMQVLDSLARYHVHRQDFKWSDEALICSENGRPLGIYNRPVPPTQKRPEPTDISNLSSLIDKTIHTILSERLNDESSSRFIRALLRHNMAIKSITPESQLLELWAAIEVLFTTYESGEDKIIQIVKTIVPFEITKYALKIVTDLYTSIKNSGIKEALNIISETEEGSNEIEKCAALVVIQDNEDRRIKLYEILNEHVLLRNRIYYLNNKLSSANAILNTLMAHDERVSWQIQRIYRARNLVIHSGKTLKYIKVLVENLHSYLDSVLELLIEQVDLTDHIISIDQICTNMKLKHDAHIKLLKKARENKCDPDNYKMLLLGY